ncbi:MAG TPA: hypothetical protein VHC86_14130 [Opitutaceae bacterium]|nr:hypothetical protein [Opitutaceae bacterium]
MKASRSRSVLRFAPLLALAMAQSLHPAEPPAPGGVEKEALRAGVYRTPANPPAAPSPQLGMPLTLLPAYRVVEPSHLMSDRQYYRLQAELAWNAGEPRSLLFEQFAHGPQLRAFEAPRLGQVEIPWSPVVTEEPVLSADYPNYVSDRLQVRFPLVNVLW